MIRTDEYGKIIEEEPEWRKRLRIDKRFIISYKNVFKKPWDILVLIFATWNAFYMPFAYSFVVPGPDTNVGAGLYLFDTLVDIFFIFDVLFSFFTSYMDSQGREITDSIIIFWNYTGSSRFIPDILALLGMGLFAKISKRLKIFGLFKILRVFRINAFIRGLNISATTKQ